MVRLKRLTKKIILLGEPAVGKTSLIRRFVLNAFEDKYVATIGVKVSKKSMEIELGSYKTMLNMMIYDVLGQHDFQRIRRKYIEGANGAVLIGDLTKLDTIEALEKFWIPEIENTIGSIPLVLIGNKLDLTQGELETFSLLRIISSIITCPLQLCSAKMGYGVEESFQLMAHALIETHYDRIVEDKSEEPIKDLRMAADAIMNHFCEDHENPDEAIQVCSTVFEEAGFSLNDPKREVLLSVIEILAKKEQSYEDEQTVARNKLERLGFMRQAEGGR